VIFPMMILRKLFVYVFSIVYFQMLYIFDGRIQQPQRNLSCLRDRCIHFQSLTLPLLLLTPFQPSMEGSNFRFRLGDASLQQVSPSVVR
jgi:hypothetical protein